MKLSIVRTSFFSAVAVLAAICACTPAERQEIIKDVPAAERATCVVLRAITHDGVVEEICATADELAPLVPDLVSDRGASDAAPPVGFVAMKLSAPTKRVPKRHCAVWVSVDAGKDGGDGG
jgi:hypothetical protein